ncbi:ABC transporter ATP-binding protein [Acinetobacter puyangensis]|uniref:ABC transporter ATP-binding protein n=1 Tax=Acinetobacter puyangensis TaxID=1096779 RepID=UPI003A4D96F2
MSYVDHPDCPVKQDTPSVLSLQGVKKSFGAFQALKNVSLTLQAGEIHCLLGENGAGKSTLCNIIFGSLRADEGRILLQNEAFQPSSPKDALQHGIAMVHQHFSLIENTTVLDNLLLGRVTGVLNRKQQAEQIKKLLIELNFDIDLNAQISDMAVGEKQRVEIIKCLIRNPRVLILDEPTAVLLPNEIAALLEICQRVVERGCSILLVTHKLAEITQVASKVSVLRAVTIVDYSDHPREDIHRLVNSMMNGQQQQQTVKLVQRELSSSTANPNTRAIEDEVLHVNGLSYVDAEGVTKLDNATFIVNKAEIVAIAGVEGNGQSELASILSGMLPASRGQFLIERQDFTRATPRQLTRCGVGVIAEDRHDTGCVVEMSLAENILFNHLDQYCKYGFLNRKKIRKDAQQLMQQFDVRAASPDVPFGRLSGGNQQKAVFARELTLNPLKFLLASQPTRGLDVGAVAAIYQHIRAARDKGLGVLLISSELDELLAVADRILVFYRGKIVGEVSGEQATREKIGAWMAGQ